MIRSSDTLSIKKLKIGNSNEFGMDLTKPILEQLFKILDPFEKSKDIQESLNKIGVDKILINSIKAKQELSYNKKELETVFALRKALSSMSTADVTEQIIKQILEAIEVVHKMGIIHCEYKAGKCLIKN